jgi:hypothetical protein
MGREPRAGSRLPVLRGRLISTGVVRALENAAQSGSVAGVTSKLIPAEECSEIQWLRNSNFRSSVAALAPVEGAGLFLADDVAALTVVESYRIGAAN